MQLTASDPQYAFGPIMGGPPQRFAGGGLAAAQQTQSKGRGDDTMLVHMAPSEVRGLQALAMAHGGSLTINPQTGLPEAGFLKSLLPTILGAGLAMTGIGAPMAALLVGGGTALASGSLKKGLLAGLGAYGGAGIGQGLSAAAGTVENLAAPSIGGAAGTTGITANAPGITGITSNAVPLGIDATASAAPSAAAPLIQTASGVPQAVTGFDALTKGVPALGTEAGRTAFMEGMKSVPYSSTAALGSAALSLAQQPTKTSTMTDSYIRPYDFAWNPNAQAYEPSPRPGDSSERRYFTPTFTARPIEKAPSNAASYGYTGLPLAAAGGGLMDLAAGGTPGSQATYTESPQESSFDDERGVDAYAEGGYKRPKARSLTGDDFYKFAQNRRDSSMAASVEQNFAAGGLGAAGQSLPPRFLSGGGDGMSDSIKANIDGRQEARLADGEFVVPADVVSHLGNGSSKAGAKKLYGMMDKIRKARTGKAKQAPAVKAEKYMPA